jgi:hypothetical protein
MEIETQEITGEFVEIAQFQDYQILNNHPWTVRKKDSNFEIKPKKKNGYLYVRLNKNDEALHHIITKQFLDFKPGDKIKFKKQIGDNKIHIDNYKLENLKVIKSLVEHSDDKPVKRIVEEQMPAIDISWEDVSKSKIDIKSSISITDFIDFTPYEIITRVGIIECIKTMRTIFASVHSTPKIFIFKDKTDEGFKITYANKTVASEKLGEIEIARIEGKKITAWDFYKKYHKLFSYDYIAFDNEDPRAFSYFRGYKYNLVEKVDMKLIQPFLDHVKEVICYNDVDLDKYMNRYFAKIIRNPDCKLEIALVILGDERTGKNVFTDVWCELLSRYSNPNADMQHITGNFNACIEGMKLMVVNELTDANSNKWLNSDILKKLISDKKFQCRDLYASARIADNRCHFIFVSNNMFCLRISTSDNRYCVTKVSDKRRGDHDYFEKLCNGFTKEFYDHLFTYYYRDVDLNGFNHRNIPITEAKKDIVDASKSSYELFLEARYDKIVDISGPDLFDMYDKWRDRNKYTVCTSRTFISNFKKFTGESTLKYVNKHRMRVYNLLPNLLEELRTKFPKDESTRVEDEKRSLEDVKVACGIVDKNEIHYIDDDNDE